MKMMGSKYIQCDVIVTTERVRDTFIRYCFFIGDVTTIIIIDSMIDCHGDIQTKQTHYNCTSS